MVGNADDPFLWTEGGGAIDPGNPPSVFSALWYGISDDGLVAIGDATYWSHAWSPEGSFRWTQAGGFERLAGVWEPVDLSADGAVIAQTARVYYGPRSFDYYREAGRWTADQGVVLLGLPRGVELPRETSSGSYATAISADGRTIVGFYGRANPPYQSFIWTEQGGMRALGSLPAAERITIAHDVSGDGRIVVGYGNVSPDPLHRDDAFVWDARHGMRSLQQVLEDEFGLGTEFSGWHLERADAISSDGLAIAGIATNPSGNIEAYRVTLSRPLDVVSVGVDIVPGSSVNPIRLTPHAAVVVALLGSDALDVGDVDETTLAFGPDGAPPATQVRSIDLNRDGHDDLVALYRVADSGIALGDTQACLRAENAAGEAFEGCDAVTTSLGCGSGFAAALLVLPITWLLRRRP